MDDPNRESPPYVSFDEKPSEITASFIAPAAQEQAGAGRAGWLVHFVKDLGPIPLLQAFIAAMLAVALVFLSSGLKKENTLDSQKSSQEAASREARVLVSMLNLRLNDLREEFLQLNAEQVTLGKTTGKDTQGLTEQERERLVFYRREYLGAYSLSVKAAAGWEIQKYYLAKRDAMEDDAVERAVAQLKEGAQSVQAPGISLKKVNPADFGVNWAPSEAYLVSFESRDDAGTPFIATGLVKPGHIFRFCRYFADSAGPIPLSSYILDDTGKVMCHSVQRYDGANFRDYTFYKRLMQPGDEDALRFVNASGADVIGSTRKISTGNFIAVSEAALLPQGPVRGKERIAVVVLGGAVLLQLLAVGLMVFSRLQTSESGSDFAEKERRPLPPVAPEAPVRELAESNPDVEGLRQEIKELEKILLSVQTSHAFVTQFQTGAMELDPKEDLVTFATGYMTRIRGEDMSDLSQPGIRVAWMPFHSSDQELEFRPSSSWGIASGSFSGAIPSDHFETGNTPTLTVQVPGEVSYGMMGSVAFKLPVGKFNHPGELATDETLRGKLVSALGRNDLLVQPVYFGTSLQGAFVLAGLEESREEDLRLIETLPELAQLFAWISRARGAV